MTERSLIRFGDGGLVVTIPKAWASYYGLKPGDKVQVVTNGKLTLFPKHHPNKAGVSKRKGKCQSLLTKQGV